MSASILPGHVLCDQKYLYVWADPLNHTSTTRTRCPFRWSASRPLHVPVRQAVHMRALRACRTLMHWGQAALRAGRTSLSPTFTNLHSGQAAQVCQNSALRAGSTQSMPHSSALRAGRTRQHSGQAALMACRTCLSPAFTNAIAPAPVHWRAPRTIQSQTCPRFAGLAP